MPQPPQRMCFGLTMVAALLGFTGTLARRLSLEASCPSNPPGIAAKEGLDGTGSGAFLCRRLL